MFAAVGTALWLGILTSVSPCPLATNVAAMGFIARRTDSARRGPVDRPAVHGRQGTGLRGAGYDSGQWPDGRAGGIGLVAENMIRLLGPVLIITGLVLLEWLTFGAGSGRFTGWVQHRASVMGLGAAFFLGVMFALAFCPVSAALFFGSLLPVCLQAGSGFWLPLVYGIGTALPVLAFGLVLAFAAGRVGQVFDKVTVVEKWARRVTGGVFLGVGVWFVLAYSLRVI